MMTDRDCEEEEHDSICRSRDIEQGCYDGDDIYQIVRLTDEEDTEE